jgi:Uncharacterised nucleotidyltransferase
MVSPSPSNSNIGLQGEGAFDLLCTLTAVALSPEALHRIATWNLSGLDWDEFLNLAENHGVLPLASRNLIEHARGVPLKIERQLRLAYESNLQRNMWFAAELARIIRHFESQQLRVIPYKGPVLAQLLYGDLGLRSFSDLDFLISAVDFVPAKQALAELGYRPSDVHVEAVERMSLRTGYERSFDGAAGKHLVELQWALLPYFYAIGLSDKFSGNNSRHNDSRDNDISVEDLLARSHGVAVGDCKVPSLSPEDSLLVLCIHSAKHLWTRLVWLADIAETLRTQTIDYSVVSSRANSLGITRILGVSFWLAKNVLCVSLSEHAEEVIAADPEVEAMGAKFAERLSRGADYELESTEYFRFIFRLRERRSDRWRYVWRLIWTPGSGDVAAARLPVSLFPLYRIVRLGRLVRKMF